MNLYGCQCKGCTKERQENWRVINRECNYSAFSGYRYTPSDYSSVRCYKCGRVWRTKAKYVNKLKDAPR